VRRRKIESVQTESVWMMWMNRGQKGVKEVEAGTIIDAKRREE
jgi:hypothetical protein